MKKRDPYKRGYDDCSIGFTYIHDLEGEDFLEWQKGYKQAMKDEKKRKELNQIKKDIQKL